MAHIEIRLSRLCIYCWQARRTLDTQGASLSHQESADDLRLEVTATRAYREMVERSGGCTTVPQVFVDGEHLGDEEVLQSLAESGQLQRALKISA